MTSSNEVLVTKPEKFHYLVGIGVHAQNTTTPGKPYLDYFFDYTDSDLNQLMAEKIVDNVIDKDEKEKQDQAKTGERCESKFQQALVIAKFRSNIHGLNACLFHSDNKLTQEDLELFIVKSVTDTGFETLMKKAKIKL